MNAVTDNNNTTRPTKGLIAKVIIGLVMTAVATLGLASPASAEVDTLGGQCIAVHGMTRGCATDFQVVWGNGWSWTVGASTKDNMIDNGNVVVEVMLNRKAMSNTGWMQVSIAGDHSNYYRYQSIRGTDPTYGAWVRVCTNLNTGKYCLASRYVTDNS